MMTCNNCHQDLPDGTETCPNCGHKVNEAAAECCSAAEETPKKSKKRLGLVIGGVVVAAAIAVGAICIPMMNKDKAPEKEPVEDQTPALDFGEEAAAGHHINAYDFPSWSLYFEEGAQEFTYVNENEETLSVSAEELEALLDQVVATCGNLTLTNRELAFYYDQQLYSFYSMYSQYMSYFMSPDLGLDEQVSMDGVKTWQQVFLEGAITSFVQTAVLYDDAMANGFQLSAEGQEIVDTLEEKMDAFAKENGYEGAEDYLTKSYGPGATLDVYKRYVEVNQIASDYLTQKADELEFTVEELSAYFDENAETIEQTYHVSKVDKNMINVRHILIQPEDTESDDSWAEAEAKANQILADWQAGEATEDSFAALAGEHSTDPGSQNNGGLYENVYPGQMVPTFNDWCFDDSRQTGDTGVVKTDYGFHIMYFVSEGDGVYWQSFVEDMLRQEKAAEMMNGLIDASNQESDLSLAIIMDRMAPTIPSTSEENQQANAEAEAETDAPVEE